MRIIKIKNIRQKCPPICPPKPSTSVVLFSSGTHSEQTWPRVSSGAKLVYPMAVKYWHVRFQMEFMMEPGLSPWICVVSTLTIYYHAPWPLSTTVLDSSSVHLVSISHIYDRNLSYHTNLRQSKTVCTEKMKWQSKYPARLRWLTMRGNANN